MPARLALTGAKGYPVGISVSSLSLSLNLKTEMRFLTYPSFQNGALDSTWSIHKNSGNTFATISDEILHKLILKCLSYHAGIYLQKWKILQFLASNLTTCWPQCNFLLKKSLQLTVQKFFSLTISSKSRASSLAPM